MIDSRHIETSLRIAEQQEIVNGEGQFMGDLRTVLTAENIQRGVSIHLGTDKEKLATVLDVLGVQGNYNDGKPTLAVYQAFTAHGGTTAYNGSAIPSLEKLGLTDALDALQTDNLHVTREEYSPHYTHLGVHEGQTASFILLGRMKEQEDGQRVADLESPAVRICGFYRYLPEFGGDEFEYHDNSLEGVMDELVGNRASQSSSSRIAKLAVYMTDQGESLEMPYAEYRIEVGMPTCSSIASISESLDAVVVRGAYRLAGERIVPVVNQYD